MAEQKQKWLVDEAARKKSAMGNRGQLPRADHLKEIDKRLETGLLAKIRLKFSTPDDEWFADKLRDVIAAGPGIDVFVLPQAFTRIGRN